ncbi:MAG: MarR family winged helix-turn-helix transcriptional regulator [Acidimicrobiia bacterium]
MSDTTALDDPIAEATRQWETHGWNEAAPGMAAVTTITRVNRILVARIETALAPLGLSFARFEILRLLGFARERRLPMGKIGDRLQVHPASVTSAVNRLERDGLIRRQAASHDNRIVLAGLLSAGETVLEDATRRINLVFTALELDADDLERVVATLSAIRST